MTTFNLQNPFTGEATDVQVPDTCPTCNKRLSHGFVKHEPIKLTCTCGYKGECDPFHLDRKRAVLASVLTLEERGLVWYALGLAAGQVDREMLADHGMDEIDRIEHGDEDSGFTDADADQLLDHREQVLALEFNRLAKMFERPE